MEFKLAVLPGDGIGPDVIAEAVRVLEAVGRRFGHDFELSEGAIGGNAIDSTGTALPDETQELCDQADAVLFGAVGGPKWDRSQGPRSGPRTASSESAGAWASSRTSGRSRSSPRWQTSARSRGTGLKAWT